MTRHEELIALENAICELHYSAHLLVQRVEAEFGPKGTLDAECTAFLAYDLEDRVSALKAKYLNGIYRAERCGEVAK